MATTSRRTRKTATPAGNATPDNATPDNAAPVDVPTTPTPDPSNQPDTETTGAEMPADAPTSGAPVSGAPVGTADHFKIVMVAGVLGDHSDGVNAATIAEESGLRAGIVARVLGAMEVAGAAVRKPADDETAAELWVRGDAELTTVDLSQAAVREVCPTCQRPMPRRSAVSVRRTGPAAPGHNGDGQPTLRKGELERLVRAFLAERPGHDFTPSDIGNELRRSSGAVGNALAKLTIHGHAVLVSDAPMKYSAPATVADATVTP